jgi:predicted metal-binding membrane protein
MSETTRRDLSHLPPAEGRLGAVFARPKLIAAACVVVLAGLGWLYLALMVAGGAGGPFQVLCSAMQQSGSAGELGLIAVMWAAMGLAMMLPTAAPMIFTYAEIADTAARKGERIVSPLVIAAGYGTVWLGFAVAATLAQFAFTRALLLDASMVSASALFSGAIFVGAGAYQFSALKHACLTQCQRPFPFFFARWETTPRGVFRLGLQQGFYCLGCCWAMMLVMFAVGVMNVIWMAAIGIVMAIEKMATGRRFSHAVGAVMIAIGLVLIATSIAAHWPGRAV